MNLNIIRDIVSAKGIYKLSTLELLTSYYILEGSNPIRAALKAEESINTFISLVQNQISYNNAKSIVNFYLDANSKITTCNTEYQSFNSLLSEIQLLSWQTFEDFCGVLFNKCFGVEKIEITQRTADMGLDFSGLLPFKPINSNSHFSFIEIYGQAKQYSGNVGRVDVDKFTAFANRQKRDNQYPAQLFIICTTSDFAESALNEITKNHFIGINGQQIASLVFNFLKSSSSSLNFKLSDFFNCIHSTASHNSLPFT